MGRKYVVINGTQIEISEVLLKQIHGNKRDKVAKGTALFVYDDGKGKRRCGTCPMFLKDISVCSIHGRKYHIKPDSMVCGYWMKGDPMTSKDHEPMESVTPEISGLIDTTKGGTHCASCIHFDAKNKACERVEGKINPDDCCAFWENPKEEKQYKNKE